VAGQRDRVESEEVEERQGGRRENERARERERSECIESRRN
jgi:hypothetical protein